jgi:hypothetical protein
MSKSVELAPRSRLSCEQHVLNVCRARSLKRASKNDFAFREAAAATGGARVFCPNTILSENHFVRIPFCPNPILSKYHFEWIPFCPKYHFVQIPLCPKTDHFCLARTVTTIALIIGSNLTIRCTQKIWNCLLKQTFRVVKHHFDSFCLGWDANPWPFCFDLFTSVLFLSHWGFSNILFIYLSSRHSN